MKDELGEKKMTDIFALRPKKYSYLTDDSDENKITKDTKKCVTKQKLKFEDSKCCLEANQLENKINQLEKNNVDVDSL